MKYKVYSEIDNMYLVVKSDEYEPYYYETVYKGSLADCEAYIRLKEGGYMS